MLCQQQTNIRLLEKSPTSVQIVRKPSLAPHFPCHVVQQCVFWTKHLLLLLNCRASAYRASWYFSQYLIRICHVSLTMNSDIGMWGQFLVVIDSWIIPHLNAARMMAQYGLARHVLELLRARILMLFWRSCYGKQRIWLPAWSFWHLMRASRDGVAMVCHMWSTWQVQISGAKWALVFWALTMYVMLQYQECLGFVMCDGSIKIKICLIGRQQGVKSGDT